MMTLEEIREKLKDRRLDIVSKNVGIHSNTIYKLAKGGKVSYDVAKKLSDYLENKLNGFI